MQQYVAFIEENFARSITHPGQRHEEALSVVIMKTSFIPSFRTAKTQEQLKCTTKCGWLQNSTHLKGDGGANW